MVTYISAGGREAGRGELREGGKAEREDHREFHDAVFGVGMGLVLAVRETYGMEKNHGHPKRRYRSPFCIRGLPPTSQLRIAPSNRFALTACRGKLFSGHD